MPGMNQSTNPPVRKAYDLLAANPLDDQRGQFSGYLACYSLDQQGDVIEHGAFAKTLGEMHARQQKRAATPGGRYLFPIFWNHDSDKPIGGFLDAYEDGKGLYVTGELDLDTELGRMAYSAIKRGYAPAMSIGYFALKHRFDREGARHLTEVALFEGSIVSVPANPDALIMEVKSVTGKATWPLGKRDAAWDSGAAHKRIVAWATDAQGDVDPDKLASVHFYSPDGDAAQNVSEYKLLFCDVAGGVVTALPKAIFACAGSHGVEHTTGISASDQDAIKGKISAYYARMAKAFNDKTIVAPWDATNASGGKAAQMAARHMRRAPGRTPNSDQQAQKALDFDTAFQQMSASDALQDEWGDSFQALVNALWSVMITGNLPGDSDAQDAAETVLQQFSDHMSDLVKRSLVAQFTPCLDDDGDSFLDPDGPNGDDDDGDADKVSYVGGMMSLNTANADTKSGKIMSAANHKALGGMLGDMKKSMDALGATHKALTAFHAKVDPSAAKPDASTDGNGAEGGATTSSGAGKSLDTTQTTSQQTQTGAGTPPDGARVTTPLTADEMSRLIRERMQAAHAVRVAAQA